MSAESNVSVIAQGLPVMFRDQTVWHDPETFGGSILVSHDFDETCFTTFISKGDGVQVHRAYELAVEEVLGDGAKRDFSGYGGLSNRAPLDVIQGLLKNDQGMIVNALDHAKEHFAHPDDITDIGTGIIARFANRGQLDNDELTWRAITEMLVIRKKAKLFPQISDEWPTPVKGFNEYWLDFHDRAQTEDWRGVHSAIVSSGHTDFIEATLKAADLPAPDVYMTDDEMRRQVTPLTKPNPYALELVENAWLDAYLVPRDLRITPDFIRDIKRRQLYIGDDPEKDGEMAANHGIDFMHHDNSAEAWPAAWAAVIKAVENGGVFGG